MTRECDGPVTQMMRMGQNVEIFRSKRTPKQLKKTGSIGIGGSSHDKRSTRVLQGKYKDHHSKSFSSPSLADLNCYNIVMEILVITWDAKKLQYYQSKISTQSERLTLKGYEIAVNPPRVPIQNKEIVGSINSVEDCQERDEPFKKSKRS
ncbi:hypothetical protein RF11_13413 [Thelohanellus kitauei]|uniref:Uncharacterized protein n=1 Tax=Thelohanellus kitauei TaxID=669202 RepID=A0A0C2JUC5_THEKT|nr:hypothetical protein RF11_13413 [Thelohanellus kitauei]